MVGIFDPACELLRPWMKELNGTCVLLPLYLLSDLPPPSPLPKLIVQYIQTLCGCGWGVEGLLNCVVDHILQEFYTLFLTRFRTYKIASPPPKKKNHQRRHLGVGVFKVPSSMLGTGTLFQPRVNFFFRISMRLLIFC
jgi:hypothetical protein